MNTHQRPDVLYEMESWGGDMWAAYIVSTNPVVPASSLTLAPFATRGFVRGGNGTQLWYVDQPAVSLTLPSTAATYWVLLHKDLTTAVSGWTRRVGSHLLYQ